MKRTKTKLLSSIAVLLICFAMLIGSTFAWFTDSASTGVNKIQAGNLDLVVEHKNAKVLSYETIESKTNLFKDANGENMKWEPGALTWETFKVTNNGNLAFEWQMSFHNTMFNKVANSEKSLKDVVKVSVLDRELSAADTRDSLKSLNFDMSMDEYVKSDYLISNGESKTFTVVLYWNPTENDNDYNINNGKTVTSFTYSDGTRVENALCMETGIKVDASQYTYEHDSFGDDYDVSAFLEDAASKAVLVSTPEALKKAVAEGSYVKFANDIEDQDLDLISTNVLASYIDLNGYDLVCKSISIQDNRKGALISIVNTNPSENSDIVAVSENVLIKAPNGNVVLSSASNTNLTFYKDVNKAYRLDATTSSLHIDNGNVSLKDLKDLSESVTTLQERMTNCPLAEIEIPVNTHLVVEENATFQIGQIKLTESDENADNKDTKVFTTDIKSQSQNSDPIIITVDSGNSESFKVVDESENTGKVTTVEGSGLTIEKWEAQIGNAKFTSLKDVIDNIAEDGDVVKLLSDINLGGIGGSEQINSLKNITIDLNGHKLSGSVWSGSYSSNADGTTTHIIDSVGSGQIYSKFRFDDGGAMMQANAATAWQHAIVIDGGTYLSNNVALVCQVQNISNPVGLIINDGIIGGSIDWIEGVDGLPGPVGGCVENVIGTTIINGGTFKAAKYGSVIINESGSSNVDSIVNIYDGTFQGACMFDFGKDHSSKSIINVYGGNFTVINPDGSSEIIATSFAYDNYTHAALVNNDMFELNIMGGTFNYDPSAYVDTINYNVTNNGSTWTVTAK